VKDGTAYPPVLISHGANDTRVELWHSQKTAARLAEATTGGPVLLRIDYHAGHGGGSSVDQSNALYGDMVTFILEHCR
jgi:prolyl oligopeptidase